MHSFTITIKRFGGFSFTKFSSPFSLSFGGFIVLGSSYAGWAGMRASGTEAGPSNFYFELGGGRGGLTSFLRVSSAELG